MGTQDGWLERSVRGREPSCLLSDIAGVLEGHRESPLVLGACSGPGLEGPGFCCSRALGVTSG